MFVLFHTKWPVTFDRRFVDAVDGDVFLVQMRVGRVVGPLVLDAVKFLE